MTVEIRQAGAEWLVEVHGEPIGKAYSAVEAPRVRGDVAREPREAAIAQRTSPHSRCCSTVGSKYGEFRSRSQRSSQ
jgi:hypothetical protein